MSVFFSNLYVHFKNNVGFEKPYNASEIQNR